MPTGWHWMKYLDGSFYFSKSLGQILAVKAHSLESDGSKKI